MTLKNEFHFVKKEVIWGEKGENRLEDVNEMFLVHKQEPMTYIMSIYRVDYTYKFYAETSAWKSSHA